MDSRIAILGANGTGKSTLLNLITGVLQPCEGTISKHVGLKLAKYSQHSADQLPYDLSPIEHFQNLFKEKFPEKDVQAWRAQLGRFGLRCVASCSFCFKTLICVPVVPTKSRRFVSSLMVSVIVSSLRNSQWSTRISSCWMSRRTIWTWPRLMRLRGRSRSLRVEW